MDKLIDSIIAFVWVIPIAILIYEKKKSSDRLLKIEQDYISKSSIEKIIESKTTHLEKRTTHLEKCIDLLDSKIDKISMSITDMRVDFARWQEKLNQRIDK